MKEVAIIGGGISGVTTAILLNLTGFKTTIYSDLFPINEGYNNKISIYPTNICAASVIPHTVKINNLPKVLSFSQKIFGIMESTKNCGVRKQRHYEVFENPTKKPPYEKLVTNFKEIDTLKIPLQNIPHLTNTNKLHGWYFDTFFADMPLYIDVLYKLYSELGGKTVEKKLDRSSLYSLNEKIIINCAGSGALSLCNDTGEVKFVRGHLLLLDLKHQTKLNCSYNYTPEAKKYSIDSQNASDVYCYPREDGWVLGGSRQVGNFNDRGQFICDEYQDNINISGIDIPRPIYTLNVEIIKNLAGVDIDKYDKKAIIGYRFERSPVRLEKEELKQKIIIHNYGSGGAGVTLSWGLSLEVVELLKDEIEMLEQKFETENNEFLKLLKEEVLNYIYT